MPWIFKSRKKNFIVLLKIKKLLEEWHWCSVKLGNGGDEQIYSSHQVTKSFQGYLQKNHYFKYLFQSLQQNYVLTAYFDLLLININICDYNYQNIIFFCSKLT